MNQCNRYLRIVDGAIGHSLHRSCTNFLKISYCAARLLSSGFMKSNLCTLSAILFCCMGCSTKEKGLDDLTTLKKNFLRAVFEGQIDEGPFHFSYEMRTVFFSKDFISLLGSFHEYTNLPHGRQRFEGKTYCKMGSEFREIRLDDLFVTDEQREFLRQYCEQHLKNNQQASYFSEPNPLLTTLEYRDINTFVVDDQFLIVIFQPYTVAGLTDELPSVKVPFSLIRNILSPANPLAPLLNQSLKPDSFISSWNEREYFDSLLNH